MSVRCRDKSSCLSVALWGLMARSDAVRMLVVIALVAISTAATGNEATAVFRIASPSIVTVHAFDAAGQIKSQGSGVVVSRAFIVSNCHVIERASRVEVGYQGKNYPAKVHHIDRERDICSLAVKSLVAPAAKLGSSDALEVGQSVFAIGSPQGLELSLSSGILSSLREVDGGRLIQTTAPISPGSSGGGLFDDSGRLIGITTLYFTIGQQLNFAVPVEWVTELSERHATNQTSLDEIELARHGLNSLEEDLRASDPEMYGKVRDRLVEELPGVLASLPPTEWVSAARAHYGRLAAVERGVEELHKRDAAEASAALDDLAREFHAKDPDMYLALQDKFVEEVKKIASTLPPGQWVKASRASYEELSRARSQSTRWVVFSSAEGFTAGLDRETVQRNGPRVQAWVRVDHEPARVVAGISNVARYLARYQLDCAEGKYLVSAATFYSKAGSVIHTQEVPDVRADAMVLAVPGSVAEGVLQALCD